MNRLFVIAIAGIAALSLASASFANPFTTQINAQLDTNAYGWDVDTLATGSNSSATTSVATVHDYTRIGAKTNLKGTAYYVETKASGYNSHACASFGSVGNPTFCEPR